MIGYPLDSHVVFNDGVPEYDRAISSAPLRELIKRLFSDGVLPDVATNLLVQYVGSTRVTGAVSGDAETYNVVVNAGFGICAGCLKLQENFHGLVMDTADTSHPRIDTVVLRLDDNDAVRSCEFYIVQGTPAPNPVAPALTRDSSVWEIGLANLHKPPVVSTANPVTVTDTRLDPNRCGVISSISEFDTSALYRQVQDAMVHYQNVTEAEFEAWFNEMRDQLSGDAAGNLQAQIGALVNLTTVDKSDLVSAINEVANARAMSNVFVAVSPTGSDATGDGSEEKPYATFAKAVSTIPKNLNGHAAVISLAPGTYNETLTIGNFSGGHIVVNGRVGTTVNIAGLYVQNANVLLETIALNVGSAGIFIDAGGFLYSANSRISVTGAVDGVILRYSAALEVSVSLTISNCSSSALRVQYGSKASIATLAGSGNGIGIHVTRSTVYYTSSSLTAAVASENVNGQIINIGIGG